MGDGMSLPVSEFSSGYKEQRRASESYRSGQRSEGNVNSSLSYFLAN
jgi:hypothetical protein